MSISWIQFVPTSVFRFDELGARCAHGVGLDACGRTSRSGRTQMPHMELTQFHLSARSVTVAAIATGLACAALATMSRPRAARPRACEGEAQHEGADGRRANLAAAAAPGPADGREQSTGRGKVADTSDAQAPGSHSPPEVKRAGTGLQTQTAIDCLQGGCSSAEEGAGERPPGPASPSSPSKSFAGSWRHRAQELSAELGRIRREGESARQEWEAEKAALHERLQGAWQATTREQQAQAALREHNKALQDEVAECVATIRHLREEVDALKVEKDHALEAQKKSQQEKKRLESLAAAAAAAAADAAAAAAAAAHAPASEAGACAPSLSTARAEKMGSGAPGTMLSSVSTEPAPATPSKVSPCPCALLLVRSISSAFALHQRILLRRRRFRAVCACVRACVRACCRQGPYSLCAVLAQLAARLMELDALERDLDAALGL